VQAKAPRKRGQLFLQVEGGGGHADLWAGVGGSRLHLFQLRA